MNMSDRPTILLLGATGLVGGHCLDLLLSAADVGSVTVLSRRPLPCTHPKLSVHIIDFEQVPTYAHLIRGQALFCCLGTTRSQAGSREAFRRVDYSYPLTFAELALKAGVPVFSIVSALGANQQSGLFYNRIKGELEVALEGLGLKTLNIFRPALLLGQREQSRPGEQAAARLLKIVHSLLRGSWRKYRGTPARSVAQAMLLAGINPDPGIHIYEADQIIALGQTYETSLKEHIHAAL